MSYTPGKYDLLRLAGLRPKQLSEDEKRTPSFNTRMMAATLDMIIVTLFISPIVDYFFRANFGPPPITLVELTQPHSASENSATAVSAMVQQMRDSGFLHYWFSQMSWQLYAMMVYATLCWHLWSATPGKLLFRMVIIDNKTEKPMGDWQSLIRLFGYIVSALPFGFGFMWIGFNKKRRGWHDYIAGTRVVKKSSLKPQTTSATEAAHPSDSQAPSAAE